jgi:hypothetical protein
MDQAIESFGGFCDLLGLSKVRDYLVSRRVHEIQEWGLYQLDAEGQAIQKELDERVKVHWTLISLDCSSSANILLGFTSTDYKVFPRLLNGQDREGNFSIQSLLRAVA